MLLLSFGWLFYLPSVSFNKMVEIKKAIKGLGLGSFVLVSPFFNNRVYSKSFLCYGNIKIIYGSMALTYDNIVSDKMEMGFNFMHFGRIHFLFRLSIQLPNMGSSCKTL